MRSVTTFFCALLLSAISIAAFATTDSGYQWLTAQQQGDGSFSTNADIAINYQATFEALKLKSLTNTFSINQTTAKSFLTAVPYSNTESLAQRLINGVATDNSGANIASLLASHQNTDGGFGNEGNFQSTPFDTYWAVTALSSANQLNDIQRSGAINYLLAKQLSSGAWAYQGDPSILVTSRIVSWLAAQNSSNANSALNRATTFLVGQIKNNGLILGDVFNSAHVLSALSVSGNAAVAKPLVDGLLSAQLSDGSWASDTYTTALVLQSLRLWQSTSNVLPAGKVSGRVVIAGSTQGISGAAISVAGQTNFNVTTDSSGFFTLSGLTTGTHNLIISANGYVSTTRGVDLAESAKDIGDIPLASGADKALLTGKIIDSATGNAIGGATIQLTGDNNYQVTTDSSGQFALAGIDSDDYQLTISAGGYHAYQHSITLDDARQYRIIQSLVSLNTVLNDVAGTISGRVVDGTTQLAIANATVQIDGNTIETDSSGRFAFVDMERDTYTINVRAGNYNTSEFMYTFSAGNSGNVGDVTLYSTITNIPATTTTVSVKVIDAVTQAALPNATVTIPEISQSISTNSNGSAVFNSITAANFTVQATQSGYKPAVSVVNMTGVGSYALTLRLTPDVPVTATTTLSGMVTDAARNPVAGAKVQIVGTTLTATTNAAGYYSISGINQLSFTAQTLATGYAIWQQSIQVQQFGAYTLNIQLISTDATFRINSVSGGTYVANTNVTFTSEIANTAAESKTVMVRGLIYNDAGELVATVLPYTPNTTTIGGSITFNAAQVQTLQFPWNTQQFTSGAYTLRIDAVESGSITRTTPNGNVYASSSAMFSIIASKALGGGFNFSPPMSQAGQTTPVTLNALIRNLGNVTLTSGSYRLRITSSTNAQVYSADRAVSALDMNQVQEMNFGTWFPNASGNFNVTLSKVGESDVTPITSKYYVGNIAVGAFTVDQNVFPSGNQTTKGHITLTGVDATQAQFADPLYALTKAATDKASKYVGDKTFQWMATHESCLACHIHAQAAYSLGATVGKATVNTAQLSHLQNFIATAQNGSNFYTTMGDPNTLEDHVLGSWALTKAQEQSWLFPQQVKAFDKLWALRTETAANSQIYWQGILRSGDFWFRAHPEAQTAVTAQVLANLLKNSTDPAAFKTTYSISSTTVRSTLPATGLAGMELVGSDLYVAAYNTVYKFSFSPTFKIQTVFSNTGVGSITDVAHLNDVMYIATSSGAVYKTSGNTLTAGFSIAGATDMVAWNGAIYVSTGSQNKIVRINSNNTTEVIKQDGSLATPLGLAVSDQNELIIANNAGRNILAMDANFDVRTIASGFQGNLLSVASRVGGGYWALSETDCYAVSINGTVQRVFGDGHGNSFKSVADYLGNLLVIESNWFDASARGLFYVDKTTLNTSSLTAARSKVDWIVNSQMANANLNDADPLKQAFRIITLSELLPYISTETRKAEVKTAIAAMDARLRARQNTDGGWSPSTSVTTSNETTTAWIGTALDYSNPPASDPVVRKAITYLLNKQKADGSWREIINGSQYFTEIVGEGALGTSGIVMTYLPRALDTLGSLDAQLDVRSRTDVTLTSPSIAPATTIPQSDGSFIYHWNLNNLSAGGQTINLDIGINNLADGEARPVAQAATLSFKNTFTNETLTRSITLPTVSAINSISITTVLNQNSYGANQTVTINNNVMNASTAVSDGTIKTVIRTTEGGIVTTLPDLTGVNVPENATVTFPQTWNTGNVSAGSYQVFTQFVDSSGKVRAENTADFIITPTSTGEGGNGITYGTQITTDKTSYMPFDRIDVLARVRNMTTNASNAPVLAKVNVVSSMGDTLLSKNWVIDAMAASGLLDQHYPITLQDAAAGTYTATIALWNAEVTQQIVSSSYQFTVRNDAAAQLTSLSGSVSVAKTSVNRGDAQSCTDTINNRSHSAVTANIIRVLVNADTQTVINTATQSLTLGSATDVSVRNVNTSSLDKGNYTCILQAQIGDATSTLGFASFAVTAPSVNVDETITTGKHGRLLVLIDDVTTKDALDKTTMSAQKTYLQQLLNANGWSYTIVDNAAAFKRELYSGQYATVALLSNNVTLSPEVNAFIVEAVNNGLGLVESGAFNRRNSAQEKALGIYLTGRQQQATGVVIPQGALGANWPATTINPAQKLDIDRCVGDVLATYTGVTKQKNDNNSTCLSDTGEESALVSSTYGQGRSVFAAFDVLDEATANGQATNAYASILTFSLNKVSPQPIIAAGKAVPQTITLTNQGVAVDVRLRLTNAPQGTVVASSGGWVWVETNATTRTGEWQLVERLDVNEVFATTVYVQLLDGSAVQLPLTIETRIDSTAAWAVYKQDAITITPTVTAPVIADVVSELNALTASYPADKNIQQANTALKQANSFVTSGDKQQASTFMLKAAELLAASSNATNTRLKLDALIINWVRSL